MDNKPKIITGAKGGSSRTPVEAPNTLRSTAIARILDLISEGEIYGLVDGLKSVYLDETPVQNADGSLNFENVKVEYRYGTQTQEIITGFPGVEAETAVGVELTDDAPVVRTISNLDITAARIRLSVLGLSENDTDTGDTDGYRIEYAIDVAVDGGPYVEKLVSAVDGKTMTKYEWSHRLELPVAETTGWQIRIRRITPNAEQVNIQDTTYVEAITEIIDVKLRYPNSALVGITIDASQFQSIPARAYHMRGRLVRVPTNYDPETRTYDGIWDGTYKIAYTNNPAWAFLDLATNDRYGLGDRITDAMVNKWELYRIAQYCDELVDDGFGGTEPRFTCNLYLQTQDEAYRVLQNLATVFRGITYWGNGEIVTTADIPTDPAYTYTPSNTVDGVFTYQGSAGRTRHTVALVSWNDMNDFGRAKVEYVDDQEGIARFGIQQTDMTAIGCTSQGQAQRLGRYALLTAQYETDTVTFTVGPDATRVAPGKIIRIADPLRAGKRMGGRISAATTTVVTVDDDVQAVIGDTLTVIDADGIAETRTITDITGRAITVGVAFTTAPVVESVWAIDQAELQTQRARVISVVENDNEGSLSYTITALRHEDSKFEAIDSGTLIDTRPTVGVHTRICTPPTGVTYDSTYNIGQVNTSAVITVGWLASPEGVAYRVEYRRNSGEWVSLPETTGLSVEIRDAWAGTYEARVKAKNVAGVWSTAAVGAPYVLGDQTTPSGIVTQIETNLTTTIGNLAQEILDREAAITAVENELTLAEAALQGQLDGLSAQVGDIMNADEHNSANTYEAGELVKVSGTPDILYRAVSAVPAGVVITDPVYWTYIGEYSSLGEAVGDSVARINVAETRINNTGAGKSIEVVASDLAATIVTMNHPTDGLATKASIATTNTITGRLNNTGAGRTIEQVASALVTIESAVNHASTGLATRASASDLTTVTNRINNTGAGKTIEVVASDLATIMTSVNDPSTGLATRASAANLTTVTNRINSVGTTGQSIETVAQNAVALKAAVEHATTGLDTKAAITTVNQVQSNLDTVAGTVASQGTSITQIKASLSGGGNLLRNTSFSLGAEGWAAESNVGIAAFGVDYAGPVWQPRDTHSLTVIGTASAATTPYYFGARADKIPGIQAGKRYCFSAWLAAHRANVGMQIAWRNQAGGVISYSDLGDTGADGAGQSLDNYNREFYFATAPAGAIEADVLIFGRYNGTAGAEPPYLWIIQPMFEEVSAEQTAPSPYSPGGRELLPDIEATNTRMSTAEARMNDTGAGKTIEVVASDLASITAAINDAGTGLATKASINSLNQVQADLDTAEGTIASHTSSIATHTSQIAGKAEASVVTAIETRVSSVEDNASSTNLVVNSTFTSSVASQPRGWLLASGANLSINYAGADWHPAGINNVGMQHTGTPASGELIGHYSQVIKGITAGKYYSISCYIASHRGKGTVEFAFQDAAGNNLNYAGTPYVDAGSGATILSGEGLDSWDRSGAIVQAPAGTRQLWIGLVARGNGNNNPYVWFARPMVAEVASTQTNPPAWNAGGTEAFASYTMALDVNGYITGWSFANDGTTGSAVFHASYFNVSNPLGGNTLSWTGSDSTIVAHSASYGRDLKMGPGFGADAVPLTIYYGPDVANASATMANAIFAIDASGKPKFGNTGGNDVAGWSSGGTISSSYTLQTPSVITFNVAAGTFVTNGVSISYNAGSAQTTQARSSTVSYYLYYDDGGMTGGTKTLYISTSSNVRFTNPNYVLVGGPIAVTVPATGGGTGPGGPPACVCVDTPLPTHGRAGDVLVGDQLVVGDSTSGFNRMGLVSMSKPSLEPCVRFATENGWLECSHTAPIAVEGGRLVNAVDLRVGMRLPRQLDGVHGIDTILSVENIGEKLVQHITCENDTFLAGTGCFYYHHNVKQYEP